MTSKLLMTSRSKKRRERRVGEREERDNVLTVESWRERRREIMFEQLSIFVWSYTGNGF